MISCFISWYSLKFRLLIKLIAVIHHCKNCLFFSAYLQGTIETSLDQSGLLLLGEEEQSLGSRLKFGQGEMFDPVPSQLLRKYVGYARKYVHPRLSKAAASVLQVSKVYSSVHVHVKYCIYTCTCTYAYTL